MESDKRKVFEAYNVIADWFAVARPQVLKEQPYLDSLMAVTGKGASILDLGCGTGLPMMGYLLAQGMQVMGVDGSQQMLEIAKHNIPSAEFVQADMRQLSLSRKFDAIIAWNSFFHLPAEDQPAMFPIFREHLNNGGVLLFTSGTEHGEAWGMNGGVNLFHGSLDTSEYRSLLEANNFRILQHKENDPDCWHATVWMAQLCG